MNARKASEEEENLCIEDHEVETSGTLLLHPCSFFQFFLRTCLRCLGLLDPFKDPTTDPPVEEDGENGSSYLNPMFSRRPKRRRPDPGNGGQTNNLPS
ncbi:hypothetical protein IEQ34_027042 [Dendrobium chrysotoxum]|uniref:Uncharacterized protein n=1 Tax=Dendrobium chrysotoxum TaxID=161865 RepID=A0AAV7FGX4_DENCH|nr:hypothetical protein IEQ34_027042 [Dendrobium chrysotoxum]